MKRLVCYCSGGLANRVRPIAGYRALAERLGRRFSFVWNPDFTCAAPFDAFFHDDSITQLSEQEACRLPRGEIFSRRDSFENAKVLDPGFFPAFSSRHEVRDLVVKDIAASKVETVVVLDNAPCRVRPDLYLKSLARIAFKGYGGEVEHQIPAYLGFHIRLTDFRHMAGLSEATYKRMIAQAVGELDRRHPAWREEPVYVVSDEAVGAALVEEVIGRPVVTQEDSVFVSMADTVRGGWYMNTQRSAASMASAGRDLAVLATAKVRVGMLCSSFFALARELAACKRRTYGGPLWSVYSIKKAVDKNLAKRGLGPDVFLEMPQEGQLKRD